MTRSGKALSRDALEHRLAKYVQMAGGVCPTLMQKSVTMHVLRHSAAMRLLRAGIDTSVIALWLGHEKIETTQVYLHADLAIKERALARDDASRDSARPIPPHRQTSRLSGGALIMPPPSQRSPPPRPVWPRWSA